MNTAPMQQRPLPDAALRALDIPPTSVKFPGVSALETPRGTVWVKTAEPATRRYRRAALGALGRILPLAILRPSKAGKGGDTLLLQAEQIETLRAAGLPVPEIYYGDRDFLILADAGMALDRLVRHAHRREKQGISEGDLHAALLAMTDMISAIHAKGLAHGRPKIRDFGWREGQVMILDLEERPWEVMPMAAAQARDVFLWIMDLCTWPLSHKIAAQAMGRLMEAMSAETERELRKLLRLFAVVAPGSRLVAKAVPKNRELSGSLAAYHVMKTALTRGP